LKSSEILQINATIIAGVLILLTIVSIRESGSISDIERGLTLIAWVIILPFSVSSLYAILYEQNMMKESLDKIQDKKMKNSLLWMYGGFVYLLVFLSIYMIRLVFFK